MPGSLETRLRTSSLSVRMWPTPLSTCHLKTRCQALWLLFAHTRTADKLGRLAGMTESSSCRPHACSHTYPLQLCVNTVTGPQPHTWPSLPPLPLLLSDLFPSFGREKSEGMHARILHLMRCHYDIISNRCKRTEHLSFVLL